VVIKWALVMFALVALGLMVVTKVITWVSPPRPGRPEPRLVRRARRALLWTLLLPVAVGLVLLAVTLAWGL
jgi:hypothetical protein